MLLLSKVIYFARYRRVAQTLSPFKYTMPDSQKPFTVFFLSHAIPHIQHIHQGIARMGNYTDSSKKASQDQPPTCYAGDHNPHAYTDQSSTHADQLFFSPLLSPSPYIREGRFARPAPRDEVRLQGEPYLGVSLDDRASRGATEHQSCRSPRSNRHPSTLPH